MRVHSADLRFRITRSDEGMASIMPSPDQKVRDSCAVGSATGSMGNRVLLAGVMGLGLLQLAVAVMTGVPAARSVESPCALWDQRVSDTLGFADGGVATARLDDVLGTLQRARAHCRTGRIGVARHDYETLLASAHPSFGSRSLAAPGPVTREASP
jgi:hypothetical protein